jgi:hypothetical protein
VSAMRDLGAATEKNLDKAEHQLEELAESLGGEYGGFERAV